METETQEGEAISSTVVKADDADLELSKSS
jgi:hypothetical protein